MCVSWTFGQELASDVTHRNAVTIAVKRIFRTSERDGREKEEMLKEDLERNVKKEETKK